MATRALPTVHAGTHDSTCTRIPRASYRRPPVYNSESRKTHDCGWQRIGTGENTSVSTIRRRTRSQAHQMRRVHGIHVAPTDDVCVGIASSRRGATSIFHRPCAHTCFRAARHSLRHCDCVGQPQSSTRRPQPIGASSRCSDPPSGVSGRGPTSWRLVRKGAVLEVVQRGSVVAGRRSYAPVTSVLDVWNRPRCVSGCSAHPELVIT